MNKFNAQNLNSHQKLKLSSIMAGQMSAKTGKSIDASSINIYDTANINMALKTSAGKSILESSLKTGAPKGSTRTTKSGYPNVPTAPFSGSSSLARIGGGANVKNVGFDTMMYYSAIDGRDEFRNVMYSTIYGGNTSCNNNSSSSGWANFWQMLLTGAVGALIQGIFGKSKGSDESEGSGKSKGSAKSKGSDKSSDACTCGASHSHKSPSSSTSSATPSSNNATFKVENGYENEKEVKTQKENFDEGTKKITDGNNLITEGKKELAAAEKEKKNYLEKLTKNQYRLTEDYKDALEKYKAAKNAEANYKKEIATCEKTSEEQGKLIETYTKQIGDKNSTLTAKNKELDKLKSENTQKPEDAQNSKVKARIEILEQEIAKLKDEIANLEKRQNIAKNKKDKAEKDKATHTKAINNLDIAGKKQALNKAEENMEASGGKTIKDGWWDGNDDTTDALNDIYEKINEANAKIAEGKAMVEAGEAMQKTAQDQADIYVLHAKGNKAEDRKKLIKQETAQEQADKSINQETSENEEQDNLPHVKNILPSSEWGHHRQNG